MSLSSRIILAHFFNEEMSDIDCALNMLLLENPSASSMLMMSLGRRLIIYVSQAFALRLNVAAKGEMSLAFIALMHIRNTIAAFTTILFTHELRG